MREAPIDAAAFIAQWTPMMAVMMLPATAPIALRYARMIREHRAVGLAAFVSGYLLVWSAAGLPAWLVVRAAARMTTTAPLGATAAVIYAACGVFQLTSLKQLCLAHCRSPLSQLLTYASWRGPLRHLRVGVHHGLYCTICCWPLFVMLLLLAPSSLWAMGLVVLVVIVERAWGSPWLRRAVGIACLVLALAAIWVPTLSRGLADHSGAMNMERGMAE